MTYREYKSVVIKYLLVCLEIEVQDRFAEMQWNRVEDGSALRRRCPITNCEEVEFNLIVTNKYLTAERTRLYSAISKEVLRNNSPRQLRQKLVTEYLKDVSDYDFLNAVRVANWRPGSRHGVKYYLIGGIV